MNIFTFDKDPVKNPRHLVNSHCIKMILEHCQILSTVHHLHSNPNGLVGIYKKTHENHPSVVWEAASRSNYKWLVAYTWELVREYQYRYERVHASKKVLELLGDPPSTLKIPGLTPVTPAMAPEFRTTSGRTKTSWTATVGDYRNYYVKAKLRLAVWRNRRPPTWFCQEMKKYGLDMFVSEEKTREGRTVRVYKFCT